MFLSIFLSTIRPDNICGFLDNIQETVANPNNIEILINVDEDDSVTINAIETYQKQSSFRIKYLPTAKEQGYYSLQLGYNKLLKIADPECYFCWLLTDEIRFVTKGWDTILEKYKHFFDDDIFRLKLSDFKLKNYYDFLECLACPDNYAVTTKKWLNLTGGWGDFWGPDSWHQCVDYYLAKQSNRKDTITRIERSIPIFDIKVDGLEAGQTSDQKVLTKRSIMIPWGWNHFSTHKAQEHYNLLAARLKLAISAHKHGFKQYLLEHNLSAKTISLLDQQYSKIDTIHYALPGFKFRLYLGNKHFDIWQLTSITAKFVSIRMKMIPLLLGVLWKTKRGIQRLYSRITRFFRWLFMSSMRFGLCLFRISLFVKNIFFKKRYKTSERKPGSFSLSSKLEEYLKELKLKIKHKTRRHKVELINLDQDGNVI